MVSIKLLVKILHWTFYKRGLFDEAHLILALLRDGFVRLGLDAASMNVETELAGINCRILRGDPPDYLATAYLERWN